jgi:dolichyl-phosphate beta-glucosyltransferase
MSESEHPYLSVIIPCWNEAANLESGVLDEVHAYLAAQPYTWEVIVANDGSTDSSRDLVAAYVADKPRMSLIDLVHGGKPSAVWGGIQAARGEIVLFADMDQSTPIYELAKLLPCYEPDQAFDVVIGSRGMEREGFSLLRKLGSRVFRDLRSLFLLRGIQDTQCGFKSCRREAALRIFPRLQFFRQEEAPTGWKVTAYDVELLYLFERAGYRLKEVPVSWSNRDLSTTKSQRSDLGRYVDESLNMAREVARVKLNQFRGVYDGI